jgi:hypothetical protein
MPRLPSRWENKLDIPFEARSVDNPIAVEATHPLKDRDEFVKLFDDESCIRYWDFRLTPSST